MEFDLEGWIKKKSNSLVIRTMMRKAFNKALELIEAECEKELTDALKLCGTKQEHDQVKYDGENYLRFTKAIIQKLKGSK